MNLLITGGCGFIGSNFINTFFKKNYELINNLINIDAMYYCADENNILPEIRTDSKYKLVKGNINNAELVSLILTDYKINNIIHFAAQSHVENSFNNALLYTIDNIVATHVLLEMCRIWGKIDRFIHVSTDEVYGETMLEECTEESRLCPTNPYAATKAGAELLVSSYYHTFKMPIIITRGNNVYGPKQYPEKLIPAFITRLEKNQKLQIQGDGTCVRNFIYIDDVVDAFELVLFKGVIGEIYNIGGTIENEFSVMQVAKLLITLFKGEHANFQDWIEYIPDRPFNDKRYFIDNTKICALGWKQNWDFLRGIMETIHYYESKRFQH